ncbi:hypothetical protein CW304_03660 [Bacillus sp. UFRGS-B20]|nr:hypothetical protein CW304_03660 [Bacillus sp. UFRGS-B20]
MPFGNYAYNIVMTFLQNAVVICYHFHEAFLRFRFICCQFGYQCILFHNLALFSISYYAQMQYTCLVTTSAHKSWDLSNSLRFVNNEVKASFCC